MRYFIAMLKPALLSLAVVFIVGSAAAQTAPQMLALVATEGEVDLTCEGRMCSAEFTTFCLQSDRFSPTRGTRYELASADEIQLLGTHRDGHEVTLDPETHLTFETQRTFVAIQLSVSRDKMDELGIEKISVSVGENVALLPLHDQLPEEEIALVTGPLRGLGSRLIDQNQQRMLAARLTSRMINALPSDAGVEFGDSLWRNAVGDVLTRDLPENAVGMAKKAYDFCEFAVTRSNSLSNMRGCLQTEHDGFIKYLNSDYWKAVKTGS